MIQNSSNNLDHSFIKTALNYTAIIIIFAWLLPAIGMQDKSQKNRLHTHQLITKSGNVDLTKIIGAIQRKELRPNEYVSYEAYNLKVPLLLIASTGKNYVVVRDLLILGANPIAMALAIDKNKPTSVTGSLEIRAGSTAMHIAAQTLDQELGELLYDYVIQQSLEIPLITEDAEGITPTHLLAKIGFKQPRKAAEFYRLILGPFDFTASYFMQFPRKKIDTPTGLLKKQIANSSGTLEDHPLYQAWMEHYRGLMEPEPGSYQEIAEKSSSSGSTPLNHEWDNE